MTRPPDPLALGVLLAGGRGERLGLGVPKAFARLGSRTLFEHALAALSSACARVWVVAPAGMTLPAAPSATRVDDAEGGEGPLAGLAAVARDEAFTRAAGEPGARVVTLAVDLPLLGAPALRALLAHHDALGTPGVMMPAPGGRLQPLAAVWSPAAFATLATAFARGERSVRRAAAALEVRALDDATLARLGIAEAVARDADTAADLAALARAMREPARERE